MQFENAHLQEGHDGGDRICHHVTRRALARAHIHAVYPLEKTAEALKALSDRKVMGKLLLRP